MSRNLLVASLGKFRANVRNAGQANVRPTPSAQIGKKEMVYLFDIDGVLIHYDNYSLDDLKKGKNIDIEKIMEEYYRSTENIECDKGKKDLYEEIEPYLNRFGWESGPREYFESIWDYEKRFIDRNLMSKIQKLKNSNKLFITSNQNIYRKKFLISELNLDINFDECFFSCDIGFVKGENEYWEYITEYRGIKFEVRKN